jgi:hypothetical protein
MKELLLGNRANVAAPKVKHDRSNFVLDSYRLGIFQQIV